MRKLIYIFTITLFSFNVNAQQDSAVRKIPFLSIGMKNAYAFYPYNYSLGINSFNLKNNFSFTYNSTHNTPRLNRHGFQVGYNRYFFKKLGPLFGLNYNYVFGEFSFAGERAKYSGYTFFKNLEYLNINCGFFYRFKFQRFGILEPSLTLTYIYPIKAIYMDYFNDILWPRLMPNLDIKYYFKRNKVKQ
jgi:hypothetical protein